MVDRVEVTWPSGRRDCYQGLAADAGYACAKGTRPPAPGRLRRELTRRRILWKRLAQGAAGLPAARRIAPRSMMSPRTQTRR